jgi:hypothetical protein
LLLLVKLLLLLLPVKLLLLAKLLLPRLPAKLLLLGLHVQIYSCQSL